MQHPILQPRASFQSLVPLSIPYRSEHPIRSETRSQLDRVQTGTRALSTVAFVAQRLAAPGRWLVLSLLERELRPAGTVATPVPRGFRDLSAIRQVALPGPAAWKRHWTPYRGNHRYGRPHSATFRDVVWNIRWPRRRRPRRPTARNRRGTAVCLPAGTSP